MRALLLLVPLVMIAGCAQLDGAKDAAADAQAKLDEARRDAQEAKDRLDRVRSAEVVREEQLRVVIVPMGSEGEIWFDAAAFRGDVALPPENLTSLPAIRVRFGDANVTCDPLDCRLARPGADVNVTWADGAQGGVTLAGEHASCEPAAVTSSYCRLGELARERGLVRATIALGDVTD